MSFSPRFVVRSAWRILGLIRNAVYDTCRLARGSAILRPARTKSQQRSDLLFDFHKLEKGLALPDVRPGFGQEAVRNVLRVRFSAGQKVETYFMINRHKQRYFSCESVPGEAPEEVSRLAQDASLVCNRQSGRRYIVCDRSIGTGMNFRRRDGREITQASA